MSWLIKLDADLIRQVIIQAATFLVFFVIVKVFFADKIKDILKKRQELIEKDLTEASESRAKAEALEAEYSGLMEGAKEERAEIVKAATADGEKLKEKIVGAANAEADTILVNARNEIERERTQAEKDLRGFAVDMAIDAAEKVSGKSLTEEDQKRLIEEAILSFTEDES